MVVDDMGLLVVPDGILVIVIDALAIGVALACNMVEFGWLVTGCISRKFASDFVCGCKLFSCGFCRSVIGESGVGDVDAVDSSARLAFVCVGFSASRVGSKAGMDVE